MVPLGVTIRGKFPLWLFTDHNKIKGEILFVLLEDMIVIRKNETTFCQFRILVVVVKGDTGSTTNRTTHNRLVLFLVCGLVVVVRWATVSTQQHYPVTNIVQPLNFALTPGSRPTTLDRMFWYTEINRMTYYLLSRQSGYYFQTYSIIWYCIQEINWSKWTSQLIFMFVCISKVVCMSILCSGGV